MNTTVLSGDVAAGDVAAAIRELKAKPGSELQVHGRGALIRWLLDNQLVDELIPLVYPVLTGPDTALDLVESRSTPSGVTIQVYRPAGRPHYATASSGTKAWREEAMFGSPSVHEAIKAETAYRHERTRQEFQSARRRGRATRAGRPRLWNALRAIRRTAAA